MYGRACGLAQRYVATDDDLAANTSDGAILAV